jgi:ABC-type transport system substrate-binding protein
MWGSVVNARLSRRRALLASGAAAALLAACGVQDSRSRQALDRNSLIATPIDTTAQARPGGTLKSYISADIQHFDNLSSNNASVLGSFAQLTYLRLVGWNVAKYPKEADGGVVGELAESWEVSPDKLTITMKLRPGVKWDGRPPTSGRTVDASDILYSWDKFTRVNSGAGSYRYDPTRAPSAPIESMTAPDAATLVLKLKFPDASTLPQLTSAQFSPHPREADGGFNPRTEQRGNGPWFVEEYLPSSHISFKRNPDYYVKGRPFYDRIETPIVADAATRLAQFKAGNIYTDVLEGAQEQVVPTKRGTPETLLFQASSFPERDIWRGTFGWEGSTPFKDQRVRHALSMLIDREAYIDALDNRQGFARDGLELPVKYGTVVGAGWTGFYLDPQDPKEFGSAARYLMFNLPEARKLLSAAGYANGFEFDFYWNNDGRFPIYNRIVEVYNAMFLDGGLRPRLIGKNTAELQDDYTQVHASPDFKDGKKKSFNGFLMRTDRPYATPGLALFGTMHKDGPYYMGLASEGGDARNGDARVNELTARIRSEFELRKQQALVHELVKYFTGQMYFIPQVSQAKAFSLWWPAIGNLGLHDSSPNESVWKESRRDWWIDAAKPPLARS